MLKKIMQLCCCSFFIMCLAASTGDALFADEPESFVLQNEHWSLTVEPRWGARLSSMRSLSLQQDFVRCWGEVKESKRGELSRDGGILRCMMSGSYRSSQPEDPYRVIQKSETSAELIFENNYPLLEGLREERRIELDGNHVIFSVKVTNAGTEPRIIYYRIQDFAGTGQGLGRDSSYVVMREPGKPEVFAHEPGEAVNRHVINPAENWYALADLVGNRGLLVTFTKAPPADIYFWASRKQPVNSTAEAFFPQTRLLPGDIWEMEVRYTAFEPQSPQTGNERMDELLVSDKIGRVLEESRENNTKRVVPLNAELELVTSSAPLVIAPMHPADRALGLSQASSFDRSLKRIQLSGTPGEVAAFAFSLNANEATSGSVSFGELKANDGKTIAPTAFEPAYVAAESLVLVHDWELTRNLPETVGSVTNEVVDAESMTPFSLAEGDMASVWSRLRIPRDAAAGRYTGECIIRSADGELASFEIELKVRPFKLIRPENKTYGTFFVYYLKPLEGELRGPNAVKAISRDAFLEILKTYGDAGCNGFAIYVSRRDDLLWVLDRKRELGMNGLDVLIYPHSIKPEDIEERGMKAFAWGVDEPSWYRQVPEVLRKYQALIARGWTPTFTPNLPLGLLLTDQMEKMVPIINCNGNAPYIFEASRRYKNEGRDVLWYECYGLGVPSVEQRLLRGIYLWKEPIDGIIDWDNAGGYDLLSHHNMIAFAGWRPLSRLGLENTRQALTDLAYLNTLEEVTKTVSDPALRAEAENLMDWIRNKFGDDYHRVMLDLTDPQYLDDLRQKVADTIEKLVAQ